MPNTPSFDPEEPQRMFDRFASVAEYYAAERAQREQESRTANANSPNPLCLAAIHLPDRVEPEAKPYINLCANIIEKHGKFLNALRSALLKCEWKNNSRSYIAYLNALRDYAGIVPQKQADYRDKSLAAICKMGDFLRKLQSHASIIEIESEIFCDAGLNFQAECRAYSAVEEAITARYGKPNQGLAR